jgi:hypothetical protein
MAQSNFLGAPMANAPESDYLLLLLLRRAAAGLESRPFWHMPAFQPTFHACQSL